MPPPPGVEYANSVGVGVVVSDRDNAVVTYLDTIISRMKTIKDLSSASSISIKVNQYAGHQNDQQAEQARVTIRRRATQEVVRDETRQMNLLDQIDEQMAHRERQRANLTADVLINTGKRVSGALAQSLKYEEQLRQQHLEKVKGMTLEELKMAETLGGGRNEAITEELMRRKEALGRRVAHPDTKWYEHASVDPETGREYQRKSLHTREEEYAAARQVIAGRKDLQQYIPYVEAQIEAHRKGLYRGPIGDIPREGGSVEFKLPPEGHPHRGPERREGDTPTEVERRGGLSAETHAQQMRDWGGGQYLTDEEVEATRERHRKNRAKGEVVDDLRNEEERDEVRRALDKRATNRRISAAVKEIEGQAAGPPPDVKAATEEAHRKARDKAKTVDDLRTRELDEEAQRFNERAKTQKLVRDRATQLARDEKSQDPAYAADLHKKLRTSDRGTLEASSEQLQDRRGRERDALEQFNRNAVALELRRRRDEGQQERARKAAEAEWTTYQARRREADARYNAQKDPDGAGTAPPPRPSRRIVEEDPDKARIRKERLALSREIAELQKRAAEETQGAGKGLDKVSDQIRKFRDEANKISLKRAGTDVGQMATHMTQRLRATQQEVQRLHAEFQKPAKDRNVLELERDMLRLQGRIRDTEREMRNLRETEQDTPGGPGGPGGPRKTQSIYQRGLFGLGGGSTGGVLATALTYQAFSKAEQGLTRIISLSWEAARAQAEATLRLQAEAQASGRLSDENLRLANTVKTRYNVNLQTAADVVSGTTRFAERGGMFSKQGQLQDALLNIAAARRVTSEQLPEFIQTAQNEEGRFAQKFLGKRIETIYRNYANENRAKLTEGLWDSEMVDNQQASLRALTETLTDYERAQALANEIIKKGAEYQGAAAERANSLVGNIDRTRVAFDDLASSFGTFLQQNRILVTLMERAAFLAKLIADTGGDDKKTGAGGLVLSTADIDRQAKAARTAYGELFSQGVDRAAAGATIGLTPFAALYGGIKGGITGEGVLKGGAEPLHNFWNSITGSDSRDRAEADTRNKLFAERNRQIQELVKSGRVEFTGGPVDWDTGKGIRVKSEQEGTADADKKLADENDERRRDIVEEQRLTRVRAIIQKLLEARQGSQAVATVAQQLEPDNRFSKTFVDLATAGERVRHQYGALGEETVALMTKFEMQALRVQLVAQRFDSLTTAIQLQTKAAKERDEVELSTDLTRREQASVGVTRARVDAVRQLIELEGRRQRVLGVGPGLLAEQEFSARAQIEGITSIAGGPGVGLGYESRAQKKIINEAVLSILGELPDAVVAGTPWAKEAFSQAITGQMSEARSAVFDAINAETLVARENERLKENAQRYADERERLLGSASTDLERQAVGRSFDRALIQQTEGIGARELAQSGLFDFRNEAIMREAQRATEEEARAAAAVYEGLQVQKGIFIAVATIAAALRSGDMSLLVRIENMTKATVDAQNMQPTSPGDVQKLLNGAGGDDAAALGAGLNDRYGYTKWKE